MTNAIDRRSFLQLGALGTAAGLLPAKIHAASSKAATPAERAVKKYTTLGRTGFDISDISFGSSRLRDGEEHLVHHALEKGVNYFDTAEGYGKGSSETVVGNALSGIRDKVYITTKNGSRV